MRYQLLRNISHQIRAGFSGFSLRSRFGMMLIALVFLVMWFGVILMFRQHQLAVQSTTIALRAQEMITLLFESQATLAEIEREAYSGEDSRVSISRFEGLVELLSHKITNAQSEAILEQINREFHSYVQDSFRRQDYEKVLRLLRSLIDQNEKFVYLLAENLKNQQDSSLRIAFVLMLAFMLLALSVSFRLISFITSPISRLAEFLDELDIKSDLPDSIPKFKGEFPEVALVAKSFERLLHRLHGYRALNVKRLLIEKRRADVIAASISDGIFLLRDSEILYMNPVAERILGVDSRPGNQGLQLKQDARIQNADAMSAVMKAVSQTLPVEYVLDADGRKFCYLIRSIPLADDLVEEVEKSVHAPIEQVNEQLERFQANILILAQDVTIVRESQEAKGHFLATLSHEIKTPITSLTMATRYLKKFSDEVPNPVHKNLIMTCAEDVDRLRTLLDELLSVTRFDILTQRLEIQKVDLGKLIRHSAKSFQFQASERGIDLKYEMIHKDNSHVIVEMDAMKVTWALSNLVINALRHTPKGGKVLICAMDHQEWVEIKVSDSGPGIDHYRQERIFDKYNPYYNLRVARSGSMGAGLAIAKEIVAAHGGRIWVNSEPGQGAEFCFTLPVKQPHISSSPAAEFTGHLAGRVGNEIGFGSNQYFL